MSDRCDQIQSWLAEAVATRLNPERTREIQEHLEGCPRCRAFGDALKEDDRLLRLYADAAGPVVERIESKVINGLKGVQSMRRRLSFSWMGLAAAALVVVGVFVLVTHLSRPPASASVALAETLGSMQRMSWIHVTEAASQPDEGSRESWERFEPHVVARKEADGRVIYVDYADNVAYAYNPNSNEITISFATDSPAVARPRTSFEQLSDYVRMADENGATVSRESAGVGRERTEQITVEYEDNPRCESVMFVRNVGSDLLTRTETTVLRNGQRAVLAEVYDYPERGPGDIYALGVPRDALVDDIRSEDAGTVAVGRVQQAIGTESDLEQGASVDPNASSDAGDTALSVVDSTDPNEATVEAETGLRGLVKDDQGRPLADADLFLYYDHSRWGLGNRIAQTARTDSAGRFVFADPVEFERDEPHTYAQDSYVLFALHPDHAMAWRNITHGRENQSYEITLTRPTSRTVTVTDHNDVPLAGARVWLYQAGDPTGPNPSFQDTFLLGSDPGILGATTDAAGQATITNLPATQCCFHATLDGYAVGLAFPGGNRIRLSSGADISGWVVTHTGDPIPGATVSFSANWMNNYFLAETDAQGHFALVDLPAQGWDMGPWGYAGGASGAYTVRIAHDGYMAEDRMLELRPGQVTDDMLIQAAAESTLVRCLVAEEGTEGLIGGARIGGRAGNMRIDGYSSAKGVFEVRVLPGPVELRFDSPPDGLYVENAQDTYRISFTATGPEMTVTLPAPPIAGALVTLPGSVRGPDGEAVANAVVYGAAGRFSTSTASSYVRPVGVNTTGQFELKEVPAGRDLCVYVETQDHTLAAARVFPVPADVNDLSPLELVLEPTAAVPVAIESEQGGLLANLSIEIEPCVGGERIWPAKRTLRSDESGVLWVDGAVPGLTYYLADVQASGKTGRISGSPDATFRREMVLIPLD